MVYFIVNPIAGSGKTKKCISFIQEYMNSKNLSYRVLMTKGPTDEIGSAQKAIMQGAKMVIAVGGDGTVQEVAEGMVFTNVPFGIIPAGSGNDFVCSLNPKLKYPKDPKKLVYFCLDRILSNQPYYIDTVKMQKFVFINIGGVGFDADIVERAVFWKKFFGKSSYLVSTIENTFKFNPIPMRIVIDGKDVEMDTTLISVCNGQYYGGGFHISPSAVLNDGMLTLCYIEKLSRPKILTLFPTVLFGAHKNLREVHFTNCKKVSLYYDGVKKVNLDGNVFRLKSPLDFEVLENSLLMVH